MDGVLRIYLLMRIFFVNLSPYDCSVTALYNKFLNFCDSVDRQVDDNYLLGEPFY